jgi:hypothetical protein
MLTEEVHLFILASSASKVICSQGARSTLKGGAEMNTINHVAPVGASTTAMELQAKPSERFEKDSTARQTPLIDNDTYTSGQLGASGPNSNSAATGAAKEYEKIGRLGAANSLNTQAEQISAVQQQQNLNASESQNQVEKITGRPNSPYQTQQLTNSLATKPDAALQSILSFYA